MTTGGISRRYFFYGTLLAGAVPAAGFGSKASLKALGYKSPNYKDFRVMLDNESHNIDAVIVTIPDFMHATAAMWAMERGKHVFVQKPLAHTIWECRQLTEAAAKNKVATQMGNQGYSNEG